MDENTEKKKETKRNPLTLGIGNQETADRFLAINRQRGEKYGDTLAYLLDAYEIPPKDADSAKTIANLQLLVNDQKLQIDDLTRQLAAAQQEVNTNAEILNSKQLQLDELQQRTDGAIILTPNPVVRHFLIEMAEKTQSSPAMILERLFLDDLQNPRANNLPYTVSPSRIREVMDQLRKEEKHE